MVRILTIIPRFLTDSSKQKILSYNYTRQKIRGDFRDRYSKNSRLGNGGFQEMKFNFSHSKIQLVSLPPRRVVMINYNFPAELPSPIETN